MVGASSEMMFELVVSEGQCLGVQNFAEYKAVEHLVHDNGNHLVLLYQALTLNCGLMQHQEAIRWESLLRISSINIVALAIQDSLFVQQSFSHKIRLTRKSNHTLHTSSNILHASSSRS